MSGEEQGVWHRDLGCHLVSVEFPSTDTVRLNIPKMDRTDMSGAIALAKSVTRRLNSFQLRAVVVRCSITYAYVLGDDGVWRYHELVAP